MLTASPGAFSSLSPIKWIRFTRDDLNSILMDLHKARHISMEAPGEKTFLRVTMLLNYFDQLKRIVQ